jgi:hypothetical protein
MTAVGLSVLGLLLVVGLTTVNGVCEEDSKYDFSPVLHGSQYARLCWRVTTKVGDFTASLKESMGPSHPAACNNLSLACYSALL